MMRTVVELNLARNETPFSLQIGQLKGSESRSDPDREDLPLFG